MLHVPGVEVRGTGEILRRRHGRMGPAGGCPVVLMILALVVMGLSHAVGRVWVVPPEARDAGAAVGAVAAPAAWVAPGEFIVRFRAGTGARRPATLEGVPDRIRWLTPAVTAPRPMGVGDARVGAVSAMAVVEVAPGRRLDEAMSEWASREEVLYVEPNYRLELAVEPGMPMAGRAPTDFEFSRQWSLQNVGQTGGKSGADIRAVEAWARTTGDPSILVAIIDTGIDVYHPDLEPNLWVHRGEVPGNGVDDDGNGYIDDVHGYDFVSDDGDPSDDNVHGTHVAGILGASGNDQNGVAGVAWRTGLLALKAFDESGGGALDDTISAIGYAMAAKARIINASWGTSTRSRALDDAVAEAVARGILFVAAAGNLGTDARFFPAAVPEALAVGATDASDRSPTFSNHGSFVDLVAPGDLIHSTLPNASWGVLSGTSMAAPHVSGILALMLALQPGLQPQEAAMILKSTADEVRTDRNTGAGRVNAARAVAVSEPLPTAVLDLPQELSGTLNLRGSAGGNRFASYRLEIGRDARPETWVSVMETNVAAAENLLMRGFDSAGWDDGEYTFRLTVAPQGGGESAVDRQTVQIRNVKMSHPRNNDILRAGDLIEVRGTVAGANRTYRVEWGLGREPTTWTSEGIQLMADGRGPRTDEVLARWDTSVSPVGAFISLRISALQGDRTVGVAWARMVHLESRLRPGWPLHLPFSDEYPLANWREFNVADLDQDGRQEVIFVDHGEPGGRVPRLRVIAPDGRPLWERDLESGAPEYDAPVVGDLDGDGRMDVVVDTGSAGRIRVFRSDGSEWGTPWPVAPGGTHFGSLIEDLDGDGRAEVVALASPPSDLVSNPDRRLVVINAEGSIRARWRMGACSSVTNAMELRAAVVQLDEDPELELVAVDGCGVLSAFDLAKPDGPVWSVTMEAELRSSPVVGDLEGDGREEIIVSGVSRERGLEGGVHVFSRDGTRRPGWPILAQESFHASPALGDVDGDGVLDIAVAGWESQVIHVLSGSGFELKGWPTPAQVNAGTRSLITLGDVDGDGGTDVVLPSPGFWLTVVLSGEVIRTGGIRAWRADGGLIDFQPGSAADAMVMESAAGVSWHRFPAAALVDLDGNGRLDIVAGTIQDRAYSPTPPLASAKMRSSLYAWELPVAYSARAAEWPAAQGGAARTGRYYRPPPPNQPPQLRLIPPQTVPVGETFRRISLDRYVDDPDHKVALLTWRVEGARELQAEIDGARVLAVRVPFSDWQGEETLRLTVTDPAGASHSTELRLSARAGYQPPVAMLDAAELDEDTEREVRVLDNDRSPTGRPLRVVSASRPLYGQAQVLPSGEIAYRPPDDFHGTDVVEYVIVDDDGGSAVGELHLTVRSVNDAPRPQPDRLVIDEDTEGELDLGANDEEVDGDPLMLVGVEAPAHGTLEALEGMRFRYRPEANYAGTESFGYLIRDPAGLVSTGQVAVLVRPVNDAPLSRAQTVTFNRNRGADIFYDTVDVDGDALTYTVLEGPAHGVLLAYPSLAYFEPERGFVGTDRFTYSVSDGLTTVGPTEVTLVVEMRNNAPRVTPVETVTAEDQVLTIGLGVSDADGDTVVLRVTTAPEHGEVRLEGTNAVYEPHLGFVGTDGFQVAGADSQEEGEPASVEIRVTDVNTAPRAVSEVLTVGRNRTNEIVLRAVDDENNPLRFDLVEMPAIGRVEGVPPLLSYLPPTGFRGLDRLTFVARDRFATSELATVHLLVRDPNSAPVVTNQTVVVVAGSEGRMGLSATDADGHALRLALFKGPRSGRVFGSGTELVYRPTPGFQGRDEFTYKVWDGIAYSAEARVTVVVRSLESLAPRWSSIRRVSGGLQVEGYSEAGVPVQIEVSSDGEVWEVLGVTPNPGGAFQWLDSGFEQRPHAWYRALLRVISAQKPALFEP